MLKKTEKQSILEEILNNPKPLPRKVPGYMRGRGGLWYWTGAMVMTAFFYEVLTGLILLLYYQPSNPYNSTVGFLNNIPYGSLILTTHLYGAYLMIVLAYLHLLRNMFIGSYKKPREMQWLTGIALVVLTIGAAYFGYSMSGDVLSQDATDVGRGIAQGFPIAIIGQWLGLILFGGGSSISLFTRLLGWHIVLAAGIGVLFLLHFFLAEYNSIMPKVEAGSDTAPLVDDDKPSYKPWYPYNLVYTIQVMLLTIGAIIIIPSILSVIPGVPVLFSPFPQAAPDTAAASQVPPYPPWFLLFVYKELDFAPSVSMGPFWATVVFIGMPLAYLGLLPWIERNPSLKPTDRPMTISFGIIGIIYLSLLSVWGAVYYGIQVPYWEIFAFFLGIGIPIFLLARIVADRMKKGAFEVKSPFALIATLILLVIPSFGIGISASSLLSSFSRYTLIVLIVSVTLLLEGIMLVYGIMHGIIPRPAKPRKRLADREYTFFGAAYVFAAMIPLTVMMYIPPTGVTFSSLYGIGLGIVFIISSMLIRIYRSYAYDE